MGPLRGHTHQAKANEEGCFGALFWHASIGIRFTQMRHFVFKQSAFHAKISADVTKFDAFLLFPVKQTCDGNWLCCQIPPFSSHFGCINYSWECFALQSGGRALPGYKKPRYASLCIVLFFSYLRHPRLMHSGVPFTTECNTDSHFSTVSREFYYENEAKWCLSAFPSDRLGHPDND